MRRRKWMVAGALAPALAFGPTTGAFAQEGPPPHGDAIPLEAFTFEPGTVGELVDRDDPRHRHAPLLLWGEGAAVATVDVPTQTNRLRVRARADRCEGAPRMVVSVDGTDVLDTEVSTTWDNSTFMVNGSWGAGTHEVRVRYPNDLATDACDRNLKIGEIGLFRGGSSKATLMPVRGTDFTVDPATGGTVFRFGPWGEPGLVLWSDTVASTTVGTLSSRTLEVKARADECEGGAHMQVVVNGEVVIDEVVRREVDAEGNEVASTYEATGRWDSGTQEVVVRFDNDLLTDECDRNLKVDRLMFVGTK